MREREKEEEEGKKRKKKKGGKKKSELLTCKVSFHALPSFRSSSALR